ncbi:tetratricopeptide repeat protein [Hymenobacter sp. BT188]|uniref:tetratricopeptide repeat protein n=1 Tax=Hymenobacter sp. BT188 TaxID=2763504 RepID=UPI0016519257|nr:tetratricopeptide repeat protein [Hymenobacter sp. BT188]MBC6608199.1 tetratricopeptide repeat protein [Hymenobacter sp. BT188]
MTSSFDLRPYLEDMERFADGQLSAAEQEAFEERMLEDPELLKAHQAYEQLTADLRWAAGHEILQEQLQALDQSLDQRQQALTRVQRSPATIRRRTRRRWLLAIMGVILVGIGTWLMLRPSESDAPAAWSRYYQPDMGLSEDDPSIARRPLLAEAMHQYQAGRYPDALRILQRLSPDQVGQDTLLYYNGIFLLQQDRPTAARSYLRRVSQQSNSPLAGKALYHLGMVHWRSKHPVEARAILRQVADDPNNPYREDAQLVLHDNVLQDQ